MRIIAGSARGLRFDAPEGMDTRPTLDRVKEAMFGMLQFDLPDSTVLDLFSGSGNLGLEAASRGAKHVFCNDRNALCAGLIASNAEKLRLKDTVTVTQLDYADCIRRMKAEGYGFDFVFIDAPYTDGTGEKAAALLLEERLLNPGGRIVLEHAAALRPDVPSPLADAVKTKKLGKCAYTVFTEKDNV